ncbi:hypothetical protein RHS04_05948 [Rhizoctonia solani]|uniref:C2H2-type domain-containing protein n=1 Tax=Rhizoctonia solani TaxID=456999 RepID=A0A8H7H4E9_9AGAM|nr:hypothetical protein RHS04_05948 [Rhizoctonia solani]
MTEDVPPRGRASHSLAVYHVPDNTLTPPESLIGFSKPVQSSTRTTRSLNIAQDQHSPTTIHHPCPPLAPPAEEPVARPVTRRVMYDPVRDSVTSSLSAASPSYTAPPTEQSTLEETKPALPYPEISVLSSALPAPSIHVRHPPRNEDDSLIRARIIRGFPPCLYDTPTAADKRPQLQYPHYARPRDTRRIDGPSAVYRTPADTELGTVQGPQKEYAISRSSKTTNGSTSNKRHYAALEDQVDDRSSKSSKSSKPFPKNVNESVYADIKGKGKGPASQSPAFRLDNLLGPVTPESPKGRPAGSDASSERSQSETRTIERPVPETTYTFSGKLPPPPYTGQSGVSPSSDPFIGTMGISVSLGTDFSRFAVPDEFERKVISTSGPITNDALRSTIPSSSHSLPSVPNAKHARKHTSQQRRKARGLFPEDNVPLAISTTTTKQSRYRPSGDRQPVACGYKDPITGVQCDEPFNRSVELRRHVRAVHVPAEALAVTMGQLSRSQATLLPVDWKPGDGDVLRPKCVCGKEFSRLDALRRHWTGVNAEVKDGKCISCPSSISKKKDHTAFEQQGIESAYGAPAYS